MDLRSRFKEAQSLKQDEWYEEGSDPQEQQQYNPVARQLSYATTSTLNSTSTSTTSSTAPSTTSSPSQLRLALATSSDSFLRTDRDSISKLLAKRRASAPSVPVSQQQRQYQLERINGNLHPRMRSAIASNLTPKQGEARAKGASKEVYGFVCWITSFVAYGFYLVWGFMPEKALRSLGVYYFPNKYWVVAIPSYLLMVIFFGLFVYVILALVNSEPFNSFHTFTRDDVPQKNDHHQEIENSVPAVEDIPLTLVNELLYQKKKHTSESSPTFSNLTSSRTHPRPRVFFPTTNKIKFSSDELIPMRGDLDLNSSSLSSSTTTDSAENSEGEGSSPSKYDLSKRNLYSPFLSPLSPLPSSPEGSPIRRTSSYSMMREENMRDY